MSDFTKLKVKKNDKEYILNVCTQDTEQNIIGTKNFSKLTVNSKNVVTSINGVNADASGNVVVSGDRMPDYTSGVDITSNFTTKGGSWTAPCDCYLFLTGYENSQAFISHTQANLMDLDKGYSNENWVIYYDNQGYYYASNISSTAFVAKGVTLFQATNYALQKSKLMMYPLI